MVSGLIFMESESGKQEAFPSFQTLEKLVVEISIKVTNLGEKIIEGSFNWGFLIKIYAL